jgi:hypothetical protein
MYNVLVRIQSNFQKKWKYFYDIPPSELVSNYWTFVRILKNSLNFEQPKVKKMQKKKLQTDLVRWTFCFFKKPLLVPRGIIDHTVDRKRCPTFQLNKLWDFGSVNILPQNCGNLIYFLQFWFSKTLTVIFVVWWFFICVYLNCVYFLCTWWYF